MSPGPTGTSLFVCLLREEVGGSFNHAICSMAFFVCFMRQLKELGAKGKRLWRKIFIENILYDLTAF